MVEKNEMEALTFDKRVMQRNISEGRVSREEVDAHLNALPDLSDECEDISIETFGDDKSETSKDN